MRALHRSAGSIRPTGTVLVLLLLLAGCKASADGPASSTRSGAPGAPAAASATVRPVTACGEAGPQDVAGDLNHDLAADFAVGNPERGEVLITFYGNGTQRVTANSLDPSSPSMTGDQFGAAVATGDIMGADTCSDIAIGAPARGGAGAVFVAPGGWSTADQRIIGPHTQVIRGEDPGDRFGAALAVGQGTLWIGAPGRTVNGVAGAGAVYEYSLSTGQPRLVATVTQGTPAVGAKPDVDDGFGTVLAANAHGVLIGTPGDDLGPNGGALDGGSVTFYADPSAPATYPTRTWTQDSVALHTRSQAGARFGSSVASSPDGQALVVGAPGRDLGALEDAGQVETFVAGQDGYVPQAPISQATPGIPGTAESGDGFGASVALGGELLCRRSLDAAVGSPGEDVDGDEDAGSVTLVSVLGERCPAQALQSRYRRGGGGFSALADDFANPGDRLGTALAVLRHAATDQPERDSLLIGVPGLDIRASGGLPDAYLAIAPVIDCGAVVVQTLRRSISGNSVARLVFDGPTAGIRYGGVISAAPS